MVAVTPAALAQQLKYGPQAGAKIQRSQYLADALKTVTQPEKAPQSWGELGARLLATAVLNRAGKKADRQALEAYQGYQDTESAQLLAPLKAAIAPQASSQAAPPMAPQAPPTQATVPPPVPVQEHPLPAPASSPYSPQDRDALARMLAVEAGGEGPQGMAAAGHVALNRLKAGYGGAKSIHDVIFQPHQFEGITSGRQVAPEEMAVAQQVADALLAGQIPDPTGGAQAFLNPDLQVKLGRKIPNWAQGQGQRIGNHVFFGGQAQPEVQMTSAPAPQAPMQIAPTMAAAQAPAQDAQPFQVASNGPIPIPQQPSAPGSSPLAAGTPPAAPPQAPAAGGNPTQTPWPTWKPSQDQLDYVSELLHSRDPDIHAQGLAEARKMRARMSEPVEATVQMINGVPFYVAKDPTSGAPVSAIPVPKEAITQTLSAQQAGLSTAPVGLNVQRDPLGNLKDAPGAPPAGYQAGPGGVLQYQPGGPADPTRPQAPSAGYQYAAPPGQPGGPVRQQAIEGGPADPRSPTNLAQGVMSYRKDLDPIVTNAMKVRQNYGAVTTGYRQANGTGDIAMINGLQKLIDEGVVKGEDVTMQMKSNGLEGTLGGYASFISSKGLLSPDIRDKVYKTAKDLYQNLDHTYRARVMSMAPAVDGIYGQGAFEQYVFPKAMQEEMGWAGQAQNPMPPPQPTGPQGNSGVPAADVKWRQLHSQGQINLHAPQGRQERPYVLRTPQELQAFDTPANKGKWFIGPDGRMGSIH